MLCEKSKEQKDKEQNVFYLSDLILGLGPQLEVSLHSLIEREEQLRLSGTKLGWPRARPDCRNPCCTKALSSQNLKFTSKLYTQI